MNLITRTTGSTEFREYALKEKIATVQELEWFRIQLLIVGLECKVKTRICANQNSGCTITLVVSNNEDKLRLNNLWELMRWHFTACQSTLESTRLVGRCGMQKAGKNALLQSKPELFELDETKELDGK